MPRVQIPFWTGTAKAGSPDVAAQRLKNWYLAPAPPNARNQFYLRPTPGLTSRVSGLDGEVRGICEHGNILVVVAGTKAYSITSMWVADELGTIEGSGHCFMVSNGEHVLIVTSGTKVYYTTGLSYGQTPGIYEHGETLLRSAAYTDGYAVAIQGQSEIFYCYGPDAINTLAGFSSADRKPDNLVGVGAVGGLLWLLGEKTSEMWNHTGASFPFERVQTTDFGCKSAASIVVDDNTIWWLGDDLKVYKALGMQPQPISPPWVVEMIADRSSQHTAEAFVYTSGGHTFYVLTFSDMTLVYDDSTGLWHERESGDLGRWRVGKGVTAWGKHIVGDCESGTIYTLDDDVYTEDGATIIRKADSPPLHAQGHHAIMHQLQVIMEAGVGLDGDQQGDDPTLMLSWSDNGGRTWSNELWSSIGEIGDYEAEIIFNRLGYFKSRIVRISVSDPVKAIVIDAYAEVEELAS